MRRVLFTTHYPIFGGPHNHAIQSADPLAARGWESYFLIPKDSNFNEQEVPASLHVVRLPLHRARNTRDPRTHVAYFAAAPGEILAIRRLIRSLAIDVVAPFGIMNPHAGVAARLAGRPVSWILTDTSAPRPVRAASMLLVRRLTASYLANGRAVADFHFGKNPPAEQITFYFPPVDLERFAPDGAARAETRALWGFGPEAEVIGSVANITPQKDVGNFIAACERLGRERPASRFVMIGYESASHREYCAELHQRVSASAVLRDRFLFAGGRRDVERCYPAFDVHVACSAGGEGSTTTTIEALACGVPSVVTDVGSAGELLEGAACGAVVRPRDPSALAAAVAGLLDAPGGRERLRAMARSRALERFGRERTADAQVEALTAALARERLSQQPDAREGDE